MTHVTIRQAREDDLLSITALLDGASLPTIGVTEHLKHFLVAEKKNSIVGAIGLEMYGETALLRSAVVAANMRGRGIGAGLYDEMVTRAKTNGVCRILLLTNTAEDYFRRRGFRRIDRENITGPVTSSVEFASACPSDAVCMELLM